MRDTILTLVTAALGTLGFSILFYVHPRRLTLATLGGVLSTAVYLLAAHLLGGELLPNLLGALVGAGFSEIMARVTKVPVPVYMFPCIIPLVPGGALYETMLNLVAGHYPQAAAAGIRTLQIALGIAGGIVVASVIGLFIRPRKKRIVK
jgi:uncharacterized membrane protein YjjB (DUF3815 family)